ncbi:MAG: AmmeMemoRadiSam system protein B [Candidatus Bipolaricaulaceae bacterium]
MVWRRPCAAGTFYPADPTRLRAEVEGCLGGGRNQLGPSGAGLTRPAGLILPHAGYRYSGPVAGAGYRRLWALGRPAGVVVLGTNHTGLGGAVTVGAGEAWATPFGPMPVDDELAQQVAEAMDAERSGLPFLEEHSIEVQLPFLHYLYGPLPFVPVVVRTAELAASRRAGQGLARVVARRPIVLVASTDFTHYEPDEVAREKDRRALAAILNLDLEGFLAAVQRHRISICGVGAVAILLAAARTLGLLGTELVDYRTSGEVAGVLSQVVGYAAVLFREVEAVA